MPMPVNGQRADLNTPKKATFTSHPGEGKDVGLAWRQHREPSRPELPTDANCGARSDYGR